MVHVSRNAIGRIRRLEVHRVGDMSRPLRAHGVRAGENGARDAAEGDRAWLSAGQRHEQGKTSVPWGRDLSGAKNIRPAIHADHEAIADGPAGGQLKDSTVGPLIFRIAYIQDIAPR